MVDPCGLEEMEIDIVSAQYKYMLAKKRGLHEPGDYSTPWKNYATAIAGTIRGKVPGISPTPEVAAQSESSQTRRES
eukprot:3748475-Pyramimonas_sp.AAC.1